MEQQQEPVAPETAPPEPEPKCMHDGCDKTATIKFEKGLIIGDRCDDHLPNGAAVYRVESVPYVVVSCGQCGTQHRSQNQQLVALARNKVEAMPPLKCVQSDQYGRIVGGCGHILRATPETMIVSLNDGLNRHERRALVKR